MNGQTEPANVLAYQTYRIHRDNSNKSTAQHLLLGIQSRIILFKARYKLHAKEMGYVLCIFVELVWCVRFHGWARTFAEEFGPSVHIEEWWPLMIKQLS